MKILEYRILYSNIKDPIIFKKLRWEHVLVFLLSSLSLLTFYYQKKGSNRFLQQNSPKMLVFTVSARWVLFLKISRAFTSVIFSKFCPFTSIILKKVFKKYKERQKQLLVISAAISLMGKKIKLK